jgi:phosphoesterase RecJ-like protein
MATTRNHDVYRTLRQASSLLAHSDGNLAILDRMLDVLVHQLKSATSVVLSTHRHCDGDGLGAQLALFYGLRQLGKQVWILNPDVPPKKYAFLQTDRLVQVFDGSPPPPADLALIFDTNDRRLVEPLIGPLEHSCKQVLFVDHHPILQNGPAPSKGSVIDISAASTGEIAFRLLQALGIQMNAEIARALYTSVVFDTQMFRYVKSDPRSHLMAAELLRYERDPEAVHQALFATYTVEKMNFLARTLASVEYFADSRVAFVAVSSSQALASGLDPEETADIIDLVMNIESIEAGALLREDAPGVFKLSLRSKGRVQVLPLAESFGGGGHPFASGAYLKGNGATFRTSLIDKMTALAQAAPRRKAP